MNGPVKSPRHDALLPASYCSRPGASWRGVRLLEAPGFSRGEMSLACSFVGQKRTASAEMCGPPNGWQTSSSVISACAAATATILTMSVDFCAIWAGVGSSPSNVRRNVTRRRSSSGRRSAGPRSKKAAEEGSTIVWGDESAFYLLPHAVRTWAPRGKTPCLRVRLSKEHLSAISAVTLDGRLFLQVREHSFDSHAIVGFLRVLLRKIRGKVLLIWDGSPIHRGQPAKDFLRRGAAKRLHLEQLPGYAPDLNPAEGVWNYLKRVELANVCCHDLHELRGHVFHARERLRHGRNILRACSRACGYSV
jgi:transposase